MSVVRGIGSFEGFFTITGNDSMDWDYSQVMNYYR